MWGKYCGFDTRGHPHSQHPVLHGRYRGRLSPGTTALWPLSRACRRSGDGGDEVGHRLQPLRRSRYHHDAVNRHYGLSGASRSEESPQLRLRLCGVALGLGMWFYASFRLFPVVVGFILLHYLIFQRPQIRRFLGQALIMAAVAMVVAAPVGQFAVLEPDAFLARTRDTSVFSLMPIGDAIGEIKTSVGKTCADVHLRGRCERAPQPAWRAHARFLVRNTAGAWIGHGPGAMAKRCARQRADLGFRNGVAGCPHLASGRLLNH